MSLTQALATSLSGLNATQTNLSVVAGNVANAQTPGYVALTANQVSTAPATEASASTLRRSPACSTNTFKSSCVPKVPAGLTPT